MPKEFYVRIKSTDSSISYPLNTPTKFSVTLPIVLHFHGPQWKCALTEVTHPAITSEIKGSMNIFASFVRESIIDDSILKILRRWPQTGSTLPRQWEFSIAEYIKLNTSHVDHMNFWITGDNSQIIDFDSASSVYMTLHFIQDI
jgi:hypothetical protein